MAGDVVWGRASRTGRVVQVRRARMKAALVRLGRHETLGVGRTDEAVVRTILGIFLHAVVDAGALGASATGAKCFVRASDAHLDAAVHVLPIQQEGDRTAKGECAWHREASRWDGVRGT
jgi:hypothetical protein